MGYPDPVRDLWRPTASVGLNVPGATLGKKVLMDVSIRIDEGNSFIVRTSMSHGSNASAKVGGIGPRGVEQIISSNSTHRSGTVPSPSGWEGSMGTDEELCDFSRASKTRAGRSATTMTSLRIPLPSGERAG